jgi:hypothetical protein
MGEKEIEEQEKNVKELMEEIQKVSEFNCILQAQMDRIKNDFAHHREKHQKLINQY